MVWLLTRRREHLRLEKPPMGRRVRDVAKALPVAGAAVIILGGILSGIVTPTEASALGVAYVAILAICYRNLTFKNLGRVAASTVETTGSVLVIVTSAALFGWVLAREQAPQVLTEVILQITDRPLVFLLLVNILLLVVGAILEPTAAILIMVPVLAPIADIFGIDGTHFAVMVIFNLMIGLLTPPVGLVLFVLSSVTQIPVTRVIRGVLPFFVPMLLVLLLITVFPALSTWLPSAVGPSVRPRPSAPLVGEPGCPGASPAPGRQAVRARRQGTPRDPTTTVAERAGSLTADCASHRSAVSSDQTSDDCGLCPTAG